MHNYEDDARELLARGLRGRGCTGDLKTADVLGDLMKELDVLEQQAVQAVAALLQRVDQE